MSALDDSLAKLEDADAKMKQISNEIKDKIAKGDEVGAWQKQQELNDCHEKWREYLVQFFKDIDSDPNFYKP